MTRNGNLALIFLVLFGVLGASNGWAARCPGDNEQINAVSAGMKLSESEYLDLEKSIKDNPSDVLLRIKAAAFFIYVQRLRGDVDSFSGNVLWLVERCPESYYIANLATHMDAQTMPEAYSKAKAIWLEKLGGDDIRITENAVKNFMLADRALALKYLELGLEKEPDNERLNSYRHMLSR